MKKPVAHRSLVYNPHTHTKKINSRQIQKMFLSRKKKSEIIKTSEYKWKDTLLKRLYEKKIERNIIFKIMCPNNWICLIIVLGFVYIAHLWPPTFIVLFWSLRPFSVWMAFSASLTHL